MSSPQFALLGAGDVFPPTGSEEPMVPTCDELGAVLKCDSVGRLQCGPVVQNLRDPIAAIAPASHGPVYEGARAHVCDRLGPTITHKDGCCTPNAVQARMGSSSVRVDRPAKRHAARFGHPVQR